MHRESEPAEARLDIDGLDDSQRLLRDSIRRYLKDNVTPRIEQAEKDKRFPHEVLTGLTDFGYMGGYMDEVDGGLGLDYLTWAVMMPGRPVEFHHQPPTEPCVNLSIYTARPSRSPAPLRRQIDAEDRGSSRFPGGRQPSLS